MFTSSVVGEGKSVTSGNIAVATAYAGKKTLLVDCDLRRGCAHSLFGIIKKPGMMDVLKSTVHINSAISKTKIENLSVMPRGSDLMNPSELFSLERLGKIFSALKSAFEIIIIDAPPVLNLSDSAIIGKFADIVLVLVQMERTPQDDVLDTYNFLKSNNIDVRGFVLNRVRYYLPGYLYNYYYGSYGYGGYGEPAK
jgi:capsular exopolysaccharide synthesis family protein